MASGGQSTEQLVPFQLVRLSHLVFIALEPFAPHWIFRSVQIVGTALVKERESQVFAGRGGADGRVLAGNQALASWSILAARMKSLSVKPLILCVQVVISTFPQARKISG